MYTKARPKRSHLSEDKFRYLIKCFSLDFTAENTAKLSSLNRHTINRYFNFFRALIVEDLSHKEIISGEIEVDESYFGPTRVRGKRGRGAGKKTIVFGMLNRKGKVYTFIVPNCQRPAIIPIIEDWVAEGSTIYSDGLGTYRCLSPKYKHFVINHGKSHFAENENHVNGIEGFWAYAKLRMKKFKGIRKERFFVYLKETEWRFNNRNENRQKIIVNLVKKYS